MPKPRLPTLTSLRFFAALAIVVYHLLPAWAGEAYVTWPAPARYLLTLACVGLPFFYALSGFVLFYVYRDAIPRQRRELLLFGGKRVARLVPIFFLSLAVALPLYVAQVGWATALSHLGIHAVFLSAWLPESLGLNFPTWSVAVEMFCYLLFPFFLPRIARCTAGEARWGLLACFLSGAATQGLGAILFPGLLGWPWDIANVSKAVTDFFQLHPIVHLPEFLFGLLLARAWELRDSAKDHRSDQWLLLGIALIVLSLLSGIRWPFLMMTSFLFLPFIGLVIWGGAGPRGSFSRWLEIPALVAVGEATYAIYCLHMPLSEWFTRVTAPGANAYAYFLFFFACLVAVAVALNRWVEQPLRFWMVRRFEARWGNGR